MQVLKIALFVLVIFVIFYVVGYGYAFTGASSPAVMVVRNETSLAIVAFYSTPPATDYWGEDLLKGKVVYPGSSVVLALPKYRSRCVFDTQAVLTGGVERVRWHVDICKDPHVTFRP